MPEQRRRWLLSTSLDILVVEQLVQVLTIASFLTLLPINSTKQINPSPSISALSFQASVSLP
jgi:hypothetical protein